MTQRLRIPAVYHLVTLAPDADLDAEARDMAAGGAEDGTLLWSDRQDRLEAAVIVHPEEVLERAALVAYVGMLGLADGLGAVAPPLLEITFTWPDGINVNGARLGHVRLALPADARPGAVPDWLVLYTAINIATENPEAAMVDLGVTYLAEEGCPDITSGAMLESFARHFLKWVNTWQDDGFDTVRTVWRHYGHEDGDDIELDLAAERIGGTFGGIGDDGALLLSRDGADRPVALLAALSAIGRRDGVKTP
jgi:biotin-(acetyl-CoA carboxylase) ligase